MQTFSQWSCAVALVLCVSGNAMANADRPLQPGQTVSASVAQGQQPVWSLQLKAGDLVQGRLQGDVSLRLLDARGQPLRLLIDGQDQPREFIFIAERDGAYGLRAEALATRPQATYALSLKPVISASAQKRTAAPLQSPTLRALQQQLAQGASTETFWKDRQQQGAPMVEAVEGKPGLSLVTFLWRGARNNVRVFGAPSGNHDELQRLGAVSYTHLTLPTKRIV